MAKKFVYDRLTADTLHSRLSIPFSQAMASGMNVGIQGRTATVFVMAREFHPDGFDFTQADLVLKKEEFASFKNEAFFACREAKRYGLAILLDCEIRSIMPLAPEFLDPESLLEWTPNHTYENRLV